MDGVVHPNVEQAIGRDRIRKALKRYENRPADEHRYGIVRSVNEDGSYEVLLDGDVQTSRCAQYGTALVGDRVLAVTKKDGRNDLIGRLGGEIGGGGTVVTKVDDVSNYVAGRVFAHAGTNDPAGALLCDGRAVSRREYWELFDAIGTTYGAGDGSSTFNLPNIESRTIIGEGTGESGTEYSLGDTGGEEKHKQTVEELANHRHSIVGLTSSLHPYAYTDGYITTGSYDKTREADGSISYEGGGQPFNVMQPYIVMRYFITTGKGDPVSGINPADYVVEWGNTGIWSWRKYASGLAECWGTITSTLNSSGSQLGYPYWSTGWYDLPFAFANVPTVTASANVGDQATMISYVNISNSSLIVEASANASGSKACEFHMMVKGKWKDSPASGGTETIAPTIAEKFEKLEPVVLYDNASGANGTITLKETAANFSRIDVMYAKLDNGSGGYNTCRVYDPDGKRASFNQINPVASGNIFQTVFSKIVISGTSITWDAKGCNINLKAPIGGIPSFEGVSWDEGQQRIYKIVGYR